LRCALMKSKVMAQILLLIGPPGSGKTTYAEAIIAKNKYRLISAGQLVRDFAKGKSRAAKAVARVMKTGNLAPNQIVDKLMMAKLKQRAKGFVLDGYPRTLAQARLLTRLILQQKWPREALLWIDISEADIVRRLSSRVYCPLGGEPYILPKKLCSVHQAKLVRRPDDEPRVIKKRLGIFHQRIEPLKKYFAEFATIVKVKVTDKNSPEQNVKLVLQALKKHKLLGAN